MIVGTKVLLRAISPDDLEQLRLWRNNPEFRKHFREYLDISQQMQMKWFQDTVNEDRNTIMFAIVDKKTGQLLGCCGLCYINWVHRNADLSIYIGADDVYIDSDGYAKDACLTLMSYGFNEINLHKIWTEIYEFDHRKIELYDDLGFSVDGRLRENYFYDGKWWESILLSKLASEFSLGDDNG